MAKSKNIRTVTDEIKGAGLLNADAIDEGAILVETEDGELNLSDYLRGFNGTEIEFSIKKKIEEILV